MDHTCILSINKNSLKNDLICFFDDQHFSTSHFLYQQVLLFNMFTNCLTDLSAKKILFPIERCAMIPLDNNLPILLNKLVKRTHVESQNLVEASN